MMRAGLVVAPAALLGTGGCASSSSHEAGAVLTQDAACGQVQQQVAETSHLPKDGPPGMGWFCDFAAGQDPALHVIALRSGRQCEGTCSNLMGWYAVRKSDGAVGGYDVEGKKWMPLSAAKEP